MRNTIDILVAVVLLVAAVIDWRKKEIPMVLLLSMGVLAVLSVVAVPKNTLWDVFLGIAIGIFSLLLSRWTKEAIGYGDSLLVLALAVHLGGWKLLELLLEATFSAGIFALFYLIIRRRKKNATIPFVPFLAIAYIGVTYI